MNSVRYPNVHQRVAQNAILLFFQKKSTTVEKKVCYKVSLCKNFHQQSCSYIIPVSNSTEMDCGQRPHLPVPIFSKRQFRQILLNSAAAVRASENSSIIANRKSTMLFPSSHS